MGPRLADQLHQVQKDLARSLASAEKIGESLIELGTRLRRDPGKWSLDSMEDTAPGGAETHMVERELVEALDRNRLEWLLEDIRILRRRETELKRLLTDQQENKLYQTATG